MVCFSCRSFAVPRSGPSRFWSTAKSCSHEKERLATNRQLFCSWQFLVVRSFHLGGVVCRWMQRAVLSHGTPYNLCRFWYNSWSSIPRFFWTWKCVIMHFSVAAFHSRVCLQVGLAWLYECVAACPRPLPRHCVQIGRVWYGVLLDDFNPVSCSKSCSMFSGESRNEWSRRLLTIRGVQHVLLRRGTPCAFVDCGMIVAYDILERSLSLSCKKRRIRFMIMDSLTLFLVLES